MWVWQPALLTVSPDAAADSWLTVGITDGDSAVSAKLIAAAAAAPAAAAAAVLLLCYGLHCNATACSVR